MCDNFALDFIGDHEFTRVFAFGTCVTLVQEAGQRKQQQLATRAIKKGQNTPNETKHCLKITKQKTANEQQYFICTSFAKAGKYTAIAIAPLS